MQRSKGKSPHDLSIAFLGASRVGKSRLIHGLLPSSHSAMDFLPTIEESHFMKFETTIRPISNLNSLKETPLIKPLKRVLMLELMELGGDPELAPLLKSTIQRADGFLLVCDPSSPDSVVYLDFLFRMIQEIKGYPMGNESGASTPVVGLICSPSPSAHQYLQQRLENTLPGVTFFDVHPSYSQALLNHILDLVCGLAWSFKSTKISSSTLTDGRLSDVPLFPVVTRSQSLNGPDWTKKNSPISPQINKLAFLSLGRTRSLPRFSPISPLATSPVSLSSPRETKHGERALNASPRETYQDSKVSESIDAMIQEINQLLDHGA